MRQAKPCTKFERNLTNEMDVTLILKNLIMFADIYLHFLNVYKILRTSNLTFIFTISPFSYLTECMIGTDRWRGEGSRRASMRIAGAQKVSY